MTRVEIEYLGDLQTRATHLSSTQTLLTDAPTDNQGLGRNFSPTDLVGTAMGSCMLTIMGIVARRHGWDLTGARVSVVKHMSDSTPRRIARLECDFDLPASLEADQRVKLENAARACPVHHSLHPEMVQEIRFHYR